MNPTRNIVLLSALAIVSIASVAFGQSISVNSFEAPLDPSSVLMTSTYATPTQSGVTDGQNALQLDFLPAEWPSFRLNCPAAADWSGARGLALDVTNPTNADIPLGFYFYDTLSSRGSDHSRGGWGVVPANSQVTLYIPFGAEPIPSSYGMNALPPIAPSLVNTGFYGTGPFDLHHVRVVQLCMHSPSTTQTAFIDNLRLIPAFTTASLNSLVDAYGQYTGADWSGKLHDATELSTRLTAEQTQLAAQSVAETRDQFGGLSSGPTANATGFFHSTLMNGRWWLVDPLGNLFFSVGLNAVDDNDTYGATVMAGRDNLFSWLPLSSDPLAKHDGASGTTFNFYAANLERKYGPDWNAIWQDTTLARLKAWGFNTLGNWSDEALCHRHAMPYAVDVGAPGTHAHVPTNYAGWAPIDDPFDTRFAADVAAAMPAKVQPYKNDPYCLGYFLANELTWTGSGAQARYGLAYGALALAAQDSPAKQAFLAQLRRKYHTIAYLNTAWATQLTGWNTLRAPWQVPQNPTTAMQTDMGAFVYAFARKWFGIVDGQLKKQDPQHLDLGCRFSQYTPEVARACAEVCDVVSFNVYQPQLAPGDWGWLSSLHKPCLISEFHFGARDRGLFWGGMRDAGSQAGRAQSYRQYVGSVASNPSLVGCHWYCYGDEPLTGALWNGENGGIGFVDVTDTPYPELTTAATQTNDTIYSAAIAAQF